MHEDIALETALDIALAPVYCPIESVVHPHIETVEARALKWIDGTRLCDTDEQRAWLIGTQSADFFGRFAPHADVEPLQATVNWCYWGFRFDDAWDEHPDPEPGEFLEAAGRVARALEVPQRIHAEDPFCAALQEIAAEFRQHGGPVRLQRFAQASRAWLYGCAWQVGNIARGYKPGLDEYLTIRGLAVAGLPTFAMLEIANGLDIPAREMDSPAVRALTEMATMVAAFDNERHSLPKEVYRRQIGEDVYSTIMREYDCKIYEAADLATAFRDRILQRFLFLRDRIMPKAGDDLRVYLNGLGYGIRGNLEWGIKVPRYFALSGAPGALPSQHMEWAEKPHDDDPAPLPFPSIAWWWDDLA